MSKQPEVKASSALSVITPEQLAQEAQAMISRLGNMGGDVIRTKNKMFVLPDGTELPDQMSGIVVDFAHVNEFYEGRYDPKKIVPPTCAAKGLDPNAMVPFENSPKKQSADCAGCPNNQFGSEGKGKACKNGVWLAVMEGTAGPDSQIYVLKLAPTAVTPFKRYVASVTSKGLPLYAVLTHFTFDKSVDYAKILCGDPVPLNVEAVSVVKGRMAEASRRLLQPTSFEAA